VARLFVAVRTSDDALDAIDTAVARARRELVGPRWATRDQWHITLQFLGNVADVDAVAGALGGAGHAAGFPARLGAAGAFPSRSRARVVWAGLDEGAVGCTAVARVVGEALAPLGFEVEKRPFRPHVTVARLRVPAPVHPAVDALAAVLEERSPVFVVEDFVLYESHLGRGGAQYTEVCRVRLAGDA